MKLTVLVLALMAGFLMAGSGCASHPAKSAKAAAKVPMASSVIVTPDNSLAGTVVSYDEAGRFVVLSFPLGRMPAVGQTLFLYRGGLKTGEVKVSGPQRDDNIVADLVSGDARPGDEVRSE